MKKRKVVSLLLTLVMTLSIFSISVFAENGIKVLLDGQELVFDVPAQLINNRTMVPMRKIFEAMGANVEWNGDTKTVTATKEDITIIMQIDNTVINVSGENITLDVPPQLVDSRTLVPARAVAESLKAKVDWDGDTQTVIITSGNEISMVKDIILYEDTSNEILTKLNIVDKSKLNCDQYVSMYDFFVILEKARGYYSEEIGDISDWYIGDTLSALDYIDDSKKSLLLSLCYNGRNQILDYYEIPQLHLDREITNYEALLYILRMVGDTFGCTDSVLSVYNTDINKTQVYDYAFEKGLITTTDTDNADNPITYKEFLEILHKALFVEYNIGGFGGVYTARLYDNLMNKSASTEDTSSVGEPKKIEIPIVVNINDDLSVTWTLPDDYEFISKEKYSTQIGNICGSYKTEITAINMIKYIMSHRDIENPIIRCIYSKSDVNTEYYFDIDISNIKVVLEGEELKPGKYIHYNQSWYAKEITLSDSQTFKKNHYYILKSYEKTYRKDEYNSISYECFKAENTDNVFIAPTNRSFGVTHLNEIHIQEIQVKGNNKKGFVLSVTPESSGVFEIEEATEKIR